MVRGDVDKSHTRVEAIEHSQLRKHNTRNNPARKQTRTTQNQQAYKANKKGCTRCGKFPVHSHNQCPAREAKCHKCGKQDHYKLMCKSATTLATVQTDAVSEEPFLATVDKQKNSNQWTVELQVNEKPVQFKIGTGADMTVVSEKLIKGLKGVTLKRTNKCLHGPAKNKLVVCGQFSGLLRYNQTETCQEIFAVQKLEQALMGRPAIEALHLISRVN